MKGNWSLIACLRRVPLAYWVMIGLTLIVLIRFDRPLVRGDGIAYLAWTDTLVLDRDIDFGNQLERLRPVNSYHITWNDETGRLVNIFPFGVAFLQAPFYLLGHLFLHFGWWNQNPDYFYQMQGVARSYSMWLMIGNNVMTLLAVTLAWLTGRRLTDDWTAALTAWAVFVGSPLFYYSTVMPLNSHSPGALMAACYLYLLVDATNAFRADEAETPVGWHKWILLGVSGGMMVLVRWQLLLIFLPGLALLAWQRRWRGLAYALPAAAVTILPLPIIWYQLFGQPVVIPYESVSGQPFLYEPLRGLWWILRQTPNHSPMLYLSFIGLFFLWFTDRRWALLAAAMIGLQAVVNGAVLDWWGGETYGVRRMAELYPLYVLLACAAHGRLQPFAWHGRAIWPWVSRIMMIGLIFYAFLYIFSFFSFTWTNTQGIFISYPGEMIPYFLNQPNRWEIIRSIFQTHLGPPAWYMPGP